MPVLVTELIDRTRPPQSISSNVSFQELFVFVFVSVNI